jgi:Tfp pilus assembly protein PilX
MRIKGKGIQSKRGVSLLAVSMVMVSLALLSLAMFRVVDSSTRTQKGGREEVSARYVSEAGLSVAVMNFSQGMDIDQLPMGSVQNPVEFGSGEFWVGVNDLGGSLYELTSTGVENGVGSQIKVVMQEVSDNLHVWAAFGDEGLTMDSNAQVDSYNSGLGSYSSQDVNGNGSKSYALSNGHVGSNEDAEADSNVKVHGNLVPGPSGTAIVTGNAAISGTTSPAASLVDMPAVTAPSYTNMGDLDLDGSGTGPFVSYIPSGNHSFGDVVVDDGNAMIIGPATVVFDSFEMNSNGGLFADTTNGPVEIYVLNDFVMSSNTTLAPVDRIPSGLQLTLLSDNVVDPGMNVDLDDVDFDSNAEFYGTLYAPEAKVEINSNFELFGSLIARSVHLDSNSKVHFDEALLTAQNNQEREFVTVAWRHVPYHP